MDFVQFLSRIIEQVPFLRVYVPSIGMCAVACERAGWFTTTIEPVRHRAELYPVRVGRQPRCGRPSYHVATMMEILGSKVVSTSKPSGESAKLRRVDVRAASLDSLPVVIGRVPDRED
jgi:hypothetical protein